MQHVANWKNLYESFGRTLKLLDLAADLIQVRKLNELERLGVIKAFKMAYELAQAMIKDFYHLDGGSEAHGPRDTFHLAALKGLIENEVTWMDMVNRRITYLDHDDVSKSVLDSIINEYHTAFKHLQYRLSRELV